MKKSTLYAMVTVCIWATSAAMIKWLLFDLPNLQALSMGGFFAFVFLFLINLRGGRLRRLRSYRPREIGTMAGLGFLGLFLYYALYYYGLSQLSAQEACILNYLWPIMIVLFSVPVLKEKLTASTLVAMACSFVGIILLSLGGEDGGRGTRALGIAACIIAAACYGLFSALNKKFDLDQNLTMMVIWLTVAVCAGVLGVCTEPWVPISGVQWLGLLWVGIVVNAVGYLLWALALRDADDSALIANLAYLTPFLSVVVCAVFLKEKVQPIAIVALLFIVGGILLQSFFAQRREKATP